MNTIGAANLIIAVYEKAASDYKRHYKNYRRYPSLLNDKSNTNKNNYQECRNFLLKNPYGINLDGEYIVKRIEKEVDASL